MRGTWIILFLALGLAGCCGRYLVYWDHPYCGVVLDEDTGEPIAGAVVAVSYLVEHLGFETTSSYLKCKETVTDAQGSFRIPRMVSSRPWFIISSLAKDPHLIVYKVGYRKIDTGGSVCKECCSDGELVLQMHRYRSERERSHNFSFSPSAYPPETCPILTEMQDKTIAEIHRDRGILPHD